MVRKLACVDAVWIRIERVDDGSSVEEFFDNETCLEGEYQSSVRGDPEFPLRRPAIVRYSQDRWPRETPVSQVGENYNRLLDRIGETALAVDRDPASIRLMGVTKRVGVERIREAIESGLDVIGENRLQEAEAKIPLLHGFDGDKFQAHFIGHLQANKARKAVGLFTCIQTVDRVSLAQRLDQLALGRLSVLIQVKLEDEVAKTGVLESELPGLIDVVQASENLDLKGLMTIPPFFETAEDVRPYFHRLRQMADQFALHELSMGMSHDFEIAIEEGATMVRVGTALFGDRS